MERIEVELFFFRDVEWAKNVQLLEAKTWKVVFFLRHVRNAEIFFPWRSTNDISSFYLSRCLMMPIELGRNAEGRTRQVTHVYLKEDKSLDDPYLEHIVSSAESGNEWILTLTGPMNRRRNDARNQKRGLNFWNNLLEKTTCQWMILDVGLVFVVVVVSERLEEEREKSSALMSIRWDRQCAQ